MMRKHYEIRKKAPQIFTRRDVALPEIRQCLDNQQFINLPLTPDNHLVCLHALKNSVAKNYNYNQSTTCFLMMIRTSLSSSNFMLMNEKKCFFRCSGV